MLKVFAVLFASVFLLSACGKSVDEPDTKTNASEINAIEYKPTITEVFSEGIDESSKLMDKKELIEALKSHPRQCIHAEGNKQAQDLSGPTSSYGGKFWGKQGEKWPAIDGEFYKPILSIRTNELPYIPDHLKGVALINVFAVQYFDPFSDHKGVVIRTYDSLEGLVLLDDGFSPPLDFYKINWFEKTDYPDWLNLKHQLDKEIEPVDWDEAEAALDAYPNLRGIKLGGWPTQIQVSAVYFIVAGDPDYIGQIDAHEIYWFMDVGIGYLLRSEKDGFYTDGWTTH